MSDEIERLRERGAVLLEPAGPMLPTEYGKRWMDETWTAIERHRGVLLDVAKLAEYEAEMWDEIDRVLREEGVPVAVSGISQYAMPKLVDHLNGKTSFTMPVTVAMALATAAPTSTSTARRSPKPRTPAMGVRRLQAPRSWPRRSATPSVALNSGTITFGACTAGGTTLLGFILADSATVSAGNALWFGSLTSTVISTTQTPPTIATNALSFSLNTT